MQSCSEVTRSIASGAVESAGWRARLALRVHLLICRHCRGYARQLRLIADLARTTEESPSGVRSSFAQLVLDDVRASHRVGTDHSD
jgi:hypothetical protein